MDDTGDFEHVKNSIVNVNVYYGRKPLMELLEQGVDLIITGRCTDSAMFLAPLAYEFGWKDEDLDDLAKGIMVGHLLECGGQGAGGNYMYGWRDVPDMDQLGFPIAEVTEDDLIITKAPNCGGLVCKESVAEQFLYEIHDPANYITPDVTADISEATLEDVGPNMVRVAGIKDIRPEAEDVHRLS